MILYNCIYIYSNQTEDSWRNVGELFSDDSRKLRDNAFAFNSLQTRIAEAISLSVIFANSKSEYETIDFSS